MVTRVNRFDIEDMIIEGNRLYTHGYMLDGRKIIYEIGMYYDKYYDLPSNMNLDSMDSYVKIPDLKCFQTTKLDNKNIIRELNEDGMVELIKYIKGFIKINDNFDHIDSFIKRLIGEEVYDTIYGVV